MKGLMTVEEITGSFLYYPEIVEITIVLFLFSYLPSPKGMVFFSDILLAMKYTRSIAIHQSRTKVVELFTDQDKLKRWHKAFIHVENLSGEPGQPESKRKIFYRMRMGKRILKITETVVSRNLPDEYTAIYETNELWSQVKSSFIQKEEGRTLWEAKYIFRFRGFLRLMAFFMPSAFKKQTMKIMKDFKNFAEKR